MDTIKELRKQCLEISYLGQDGNLQSTFSALDIMWTLYDKILKDDDKFILSKGQASLGLYAVLAEKGIISKDELKSFCKLNSRFGMQIDRTKFNEEFMISAGSLGHGFPMAIGIAMANKIKKSTAKVYVLVGDGELNEGTMWESIILACHKKLDNLCLIIDDNNSLGKMINIDNLGEILIRFGFFVNTVDGHNQKDMYNALTTHTIDQPLVVIAKTQRGYGSKTMMEDNSWFHRSPNKAELNMLISEVDTF